MPYIEFDEFSINDDCCDDIITYEVINPTNLGINTDSSVYPAVAIGNKVKFYSNKFEAKNINFYVKATSIKATPT